ncbi:hypothetical protein BGX28_010028 [Mortierella sp. GBA30]|nr:hypothetical protein BGX28_010028 [Mortierella sp. GBA30]
MEYLESEERTNYPLSMSVEDYGASLGLTAKVVQPHDPDRICGYMQEALNNLARTLELAPSTPIWQLEVIPPEERQLLLRDWNAAQQNYPDHLCLHQLFEQQVERTPEAIAIVHGDQSLTYAELNYRANCLAHHLVALGVKPDSLVAICVERSIAMIFAVLAVLKAGGAYVPLDPFYASGRLRDIIADAAPSILLADRVGRDVLGDATLVYLTVVDPSMPRLESASNLQIVGLTSCHLAYVIYTSGSTGAPKGVMLEHQGAVNLVYDRPALFDIQPESRVLQYTSLGFDHSVSEIFSALRCGASLHLLNDDIRLDRYQLWDYMKQRSITHVSFTPTLLQDCKEMPALHALKTLVVMGEAMPQSLPNFLRDVAPNGIIVNSYGPTECSVSSTVWKIPFDFSGDHVPIGRPLPNKTIYLLDIHGNPVPLGAIGEMYIGGVGVARGYLNRPDLTAEKFVADPFTVESGTRMYKTGDLARHFPDGTLMHVGRSDHQVKIRGFRIELGEIEARLTEHPSVSEAVVIALDDGSNKRLVAYVIERHQALLESAANTAEATMTSQLAFALRSYLATKLPEYMVPAAFVRMDTLPLTHNGKLDRKALPSPEGSAFAFQAYEEPRGEVENMLSSIWRELLKVERVGRNDGFFNLGGHSLMAVRMIGRIRAMLGFNLSLRTLFEAPTIAELAPRLLATGAAQDESYDVLLPIKPRGSRPPLFCIHPGIGLSWCFTGLSTQMDPEQPLYGLQARGFVGDGKMAETLEEMVVDYIDQIRSIQPHGPYHLLGYSFGGLVAHTMASYLEEQGERVALVALMDTRPDLGRRAQHASRGDEDDTVAKADLQEIFLGNMDRYSTEIINSFMDKILMVHRNILRINAQTHRVIKGNLLIFRATVLSDDVKELLSPDDWKPYVLGETWVCDIECEHARMDSPESTASIGRVLNQMLKELHRQAQRED